MANPSKRDSAAQKVVSAARAVVTHQVGLPVGCQRLQRTLSWLSPFEQELPTVFDDYMKAVSELPLGSERLSWDRKVLKEKDVVLESINQRFRQQLFEACWSLIDRFGQ